LSKFNQRTPRGEATTKIGHRLLGAAFGRNQIRNTKQIQMTKNPMLQTLRKPHLIYALRLCILKNEHKKQEVDGL